LNCNSVVLRYTSEHIVLSVCLAQQSQNIQQNLGCTEMCQRDTLLANSCDCFDS
jgi:hypothetical protein